MSTLSLQVIRGGTACSAKKWKQSKRHARGAGRRLTSATIDTASTIAGTKLGATGQPLAGVRSAALAGSVDANAGAETAQVEPCRNTCVGAILGGMPTMGLPTDWCDAYRALKPRADESHQRGIHNSWWSNCKSVLDKWYPTLWCCPGR